MRPRITLYTVAAVTVAVVACGEDLTNPSTNDAAGAMVATLDLDHGGAVTFLDLGDGHIGIAERAPRQARFVFPAMIQNLNATPLEVYLALRPGNAGVPDPLLRDHRRTAELRGVSHSPRALTVAAAGATPLADPGYASYACDSSGSQWVADWKNAFVGITKYRSATYKHSQGDPLTFYPGAPVYNGTNTNSITYLGACNGDGRRTLTMAVQRRTSGKWVEISLATLDSYEKYTFYSGVPAAYRGRIYTLPSDPHEHYGIGAAWTLSPSEASP